MAGLLLGCLVARAWAWGEEPPPAPAPAAGEDTAAGPLEAASPAMDFGIVEQNQEYTRQVVLRNTGVQPLTELHVQTDCGCYSAALSARELAPGGTATLSVVFRTLTFSGPLHKSLVLGYREPPDLKRSLRIGLKLEILAGVVSHPGRLHLGDVREGERPEGRVRVGWYEGVGRPFQIRAIEVGKAPIEARWAPWQGTEDPRWRGYEIHLRFRDPPANGPYFSEIEVQTSDEARPRILIPVTAMVSGHIYIPRPRVYLGLLRAGTATSVDVAFRPQAAGQPLGSVQVQVTSGLVKARLLPDEGPQGERRVRIELTGNEAPGPLDDVVELRCSAAPGEVARIEVRGRIFGVPPSDR